MWRIIADLYPQLCLAFCLVGNRIIQTSIQCIGIVYIGLNIAQTTQQDRQDVNLDPLIIFEIAAYWIYAISLEVELLLFSDAFSR